MKKILTIAAIVVAVAVAAAMGIYLFNLNRDVSKLKEENRLSKLKTEEEMAKKEKIKQDEKKQAIKEARARAIEKAKKEKQAEMLRRVKMAKDAPQPPRTPDRTDTGPPRNNADLDNVSRAKDYMRSRIRHSAGRSQSEHYKPVELPIMP